MLNYKIQTNSGEGHLEALLPDQPTTVDPARLPGPATAADLDVLLVNPPMPAAGPWSHKYAGVARRAFRNMTWPQVSLAQVAAMLAPDYSVDVVDAAAERLSWTEFEALLRQRQPRYYITQVRASLVENDMSGVSLAHKLGAKTITFGAHASAIYRKILDRYPGLDFVIRGEPELTLRELLDTLEQAAGRWSEARAEPRRWAQLKKMFSAANPAWQPAWRSAVDLDDRLGQVQGLARRGPQGVLVNPDRPLLPNLNDLPLPYHHLLPVNLYQLSLLKGPYAFIVTGRSRLPDQQLPNGPGRVPLMVRSRSPENMMAELWFLHDLGVRNAHMIGSLFTADRELVLGLCHMMVEEELPLRWTCNAYVNSVDEELLALMGRAGCEYIFWNMESALERDPAQGQTNIEPGQVPQALGWAKKAGIKNWGYFTMGLPGETEETIMETITYSKRLPLDLALFQLAGPTPRSPFFFDLIEDGWSRVDPQQRVSRTTLPGHTHLNVEALEYWQRRAFREWVLRPGPIWKMITGFNTWAGYRQAGSLVLNP